MKILDTIRALVASAGTKRIIKEDMTEAECRRVVKELARRAIADRARCLVNLGMKPRKALDTARREWKNQHGRFR